LREAVINAIVHRDYGDTADIQIKIFENALQVWSPGFLPFNVTVEDLLDPQHTSKPRNKLIAQVFYDIGLIERYGSGIYRMLEACQDAGLPPPVLENFSGGFRIKFMQAEGEEVSDSSNVPLNGALNGALNEGLTRLLVTVQETPGIQRKELGGKLGISDRTLDRYIAELISGGKIERRGSKKTSGYWPL
jgi:ATP-dependent DNA helicase RecG